MGLILAGWVFMPSSIIFPVFRPRSAFFFEWAFAICFAIPYPESKNALTRDLNGQWDPAGNGNDVPGGARSSGEVQKGSGNSGRRFRAVSTRELAPDDPQGPRDVHLRMRRPALYQTHRSSSESTPGEANSERFCPRIGTG